MDAGTGLFRIQSGKSGKPVNSLNDKILDCLWIARLYEKNFDRVDTVIGIILVQIMEEFYSAFAGFRSGIGPLI